MVKGGFDYRPGHSKNDHSHKGLDTMAQVNGRTIKNTTILSQSGVPVEVAQGYWTDRVIERPHSFKGIYDVDDTRTLYTSMSHAGKVGVSVLVEFYPGQPVMARGTVSYDAEDREIAAHLASQETADVFGDQYGEAITAAAFLSGLDVEQRRMVLDLAAKIAQFHF